MLTSAVLAVVMIASVASGQMPCPGHLKFHLGENLGKVELRELCSLDEDPPRVELVFKQVQCAVMGEGEYYNGEGFFEDYVCNRIEDPTLAGNFVKLEWPFLCTPGVGMEPVEVTEGDPAFVDADLLLYNAETEEDIDTYQTYLSVHPTELITACAMDVVQATDEKTENTAEKNTTEKKSGKKCVPMSQKTIERLRVNNMGPRLCVKENTTTDATAEEQ